MDCASVPISALPEYSGGVHGCAWCLAVRACVSVPLDGDRQVCNFTNAACPGVSVATGFGLTGDSASLCPSESVEGFEVFGWFGVTCIGILVLAVVPGRSSYRNCSRAIVSLLCRRSAGESSADVEPTSSGTTALPSHKPKFALIPSPFRPAVRGPHSTCSVFRDLFRWLRITAAIVQYASSIYLVVAYYNNGNTNWSIAALSFVGVDYLLGVLLIGVRSSELKTAINDYRFRNFFSMRDDMLRADSFPLMWLSALLGLSAVYFLVYPWQLRSVNMFHPYSRAPYRPLVEHRSSFSVLFTGYVLLVDQVCDYHFKLLGPKLSFHFIVSSSCSKSYVLT
jgi:hypothetical protein